MRVHQFLKIKDARNQLLMALCVTFAVTGVAVYLFFLVLGKHFGPNTDSLDTFFFEMVLLGGKHYSPADSVVHFSYRTFQAILLMSILLVVGKSKSKLMAVSLASLLLLFLFAWLYPGLHIYM